MKLIELAKLGMKHKKELIAIGFDLSRLENAKSKSFELANLQAKVNSSLKETNPKKVLRDKAYFHLKEAVNEIRLAGQYLFWRDNLRLMGYVSPYFRNRNDKRKNRDED